jgi:polyhydroxybutyrate depolymerase
MKPSKNYSLFIFMLGILLNFNTTVFGQQSTVKTIQHDGLTRTYRIYVPNSYTGQENVPLLFNLHGYTSNAQEQEFYGDFRPIADTANFILIHPQGTLDASNNMHWDAFNVSGVDDIGFISRLIDTLASNYAIDLNRVYSVGMSNGGYMSYELACELGHKITAVGSVTGSMAINRPLTCNPIKPTPIIQIHGTQDPTVPYNGNATSTSIPNLINYWVGHNNCNATPTVTQVPDSDPTDFSTVEHSLYTNGDNNTTVSLFKVINGGHTWPGAPITIGVTNQDINASVEIWKFFQAYDTETLLSLAEQAINTALKVYPNPSSGAINIESDDQINTIAVFDLSGKKIYEIQVDSNSHILPLNEKGVYFLHIHTIQGVIKQKVVVF